MFDFSWPPITARPTAEVPFPFSALLRRVADATAVDPRGAPSFRAVLIPLGRSLQRAAAAPAFFESPRVVVAVEGHPA